MDRLPTIAGWIIGLLLLVGLFSLVPPASCRDGWGSPSIGKQGACAYHGGVNRHGALVFLSIAASVGAGLFTSGWLSAIVDRRKKVLFKRNLVPPEADASAEKIIIYAILAELKIEFLYKGQKDYIPTMRVVSPTSLSSTKRSYGKPGLPCVVGFCHTRHANRTFVLDRISRLKLHEN